jgi:hypothetical protein
MMSRPAVLCALAFLATSCAAFKDKRTPSGEFCSDMPVIPAGDEPDLEFHRLQPIQSDIRARTEAERLESLRKAACAVGGDAIIEAVNEEVRNDQAQYVLVSSGTAVLWVRPKGSEVKPLTTHRKKKQESAAAPEATTDPTATPSAAPTAAPSAAPVASAAPTATPSAAPTAAPTAPPAKTSKLPTNAAPKPVGSKK